MALTDNRTQLQDCEAVGDVSGDSTADPQSNTSEAGVVIQGTNALQFQVTNAQEYLAYDLDAAGATFNLDLSDSTIYVMVKDNLHDSFANLGGQIVLDDTADGTSTTTIGYAVAGYDVIGLPYEKKYSAMKLDVSVIVASPGTAGVDFEQHNGTEANLDQTIIKQVGYGSIHLIKGQGTIPNTFFDGIYYISNSSYAASVTGGTTGTPETMADLVGDDITVGAGMFSNPVGSTYYIFAPTEWGAATGNTAFSGTDEQWFYLGDNGGGHSVGTGNFFMRLLGGTGTNIFRQTRVSNINVGSRCPFDMSHASFDELELDTTTWIDFGAITMPTVDVSKFCNSSTFINCAQANLQSLDMDGCTFIGTTDATGAIIWDADDGSEENQVNMSFISDGTGHAIYLTVNTASTTTFNITGYEVSGYESTSGGATGNTVFLIDNQADGDIVINVVDGTGAFSYELTSGTASSVTVNQSVSVTVAGVSRGTPVKIIARETLGSVTTGDVLFEGFASATGQVSYSHNDEGSLDISVVARNQGVATACVADDGGVFVDETSEGSSNTTADMTLLPTTPVVSDAYYFGHQEEFSRLKIDVSTAQAKGTVVTWEYWNGAWVALSGVTDASSSFSVAGKSIVSWTAPGDWATTSVTNQANAGAMYFVRARVTTAGGAGATAVGRKVQLDTTRYLPYTAAREIATGAGLADNATWQEDTISKFAPGD